MQWPGRVAREGEKEGGDVEWGKVLVGHTVSRIAVKHKFLNFPMDVIPMLMFQDGGTVLVMAKEDVVGIEGDVNYVGGRQVNKGR